MPLLKRREFKPAKLPPDLRPTEEVFHCKITNEIFRDYDEFFKRTILCNSLVWSCSLTGKPNLTYQEAVESEDRARRYLASFPVYLEAPVLFLASLTRRGNLADLCDDVFVFARDRYFIGEIVDVARHGTRETCQVTAVIPPSLNGKALEESSDDDVILIEDDGSEQVVKSPKLVISPRMPKPETLDPSLYRYKVMSLQGNGTFEMEAAKLSRKKGLYTREKNKLYLKQHCEVQNHVWAPTPEYREKFSLEDRTFSEFFAGPQPVFKFTPAKRVKKTVRVESTESEAGTDEDDIPLTEVRKKEKAKEKKKKKESPEAIKKKKEKVSPETDKSKKPRISAEERLRMAEEKANMRAALKEKMRQEKEMMREKLAMEKARAKELLRVQKEEEKAARKELMRKTFEQEKEKRRKEREAQREEREAKEKILKEWRKPRDDLECDDLKELPWPSPIRSKIPVEIFGDVLMLLEFCHIFAEHLDLEDFPDGITLEVIEKALLSKEVDGPLYDLLKCLMSAIFKMQDEEEEDEKFDLEEHGVQAPSADLSETLNDEDPTYGALTSAATAATAWPQIHHGTPLRSLPMDSTTISEVLRLHFLASGARTSSQNIKWRYQQRGGYTPHDDPGLEFRIHEPVILKALTTGNVYDLSPVCKMKIVNTLTGQILSYVTMRDLIEESYETWQNTRKEWREFTRAERHREREEATARWKQKMEERAKEKELERQRREQKEKERQELLRRDEQNITAAVTAVMAANGLQYPPAAGSMGLNPTQPSTSNADGAVNQGETAARTEIESVNNSAAVGKEPEKQPTVEELEAKRKKEEREAKKAAEKEKRLAIERAARKEAFERQEQEYAEQMASASAKYSVNPLGSDRIFRRYWLFNSVPGLFVERDDTYLEDFDFTPVPQNPRSNPLLPHNTKPQGVPNQLQPQPPQVQVVEEVKEHDTSNSSNKENIDIEALGTSTPNQGAVLLGEQAKSQEVINGIIQEPEVKILTPEPPDPCMTHKEHVHWAYYNTPEQIDHLIASLNQRGFRESALKEALLQEKKNVVDSLKDMPTEFLMSGDDITEGPDMSSTPRQVVVKMNSGKKGLVSDHANGEESLELLLREQILYIEDRVWQGGLGIIKVKDRNRWIAAIEQGAYDRQCNEISWGPVWARSLLDDKDFLNMSGSDLPLADDDKPPAFKLKDRVSELKKTEGSTGSPSSTRCSTPSNLIEQVVRDMACALLQVSQGVGDKYLKEPLGVEDPTAGVRKSRRQAGKQGDESDSEEEREGEKKPRKNTRECWEESLMASTSLSQVFLHLNTLERSIIWARSLLNLRCRICRRKGDAEAMLICDGCDRGHHMYCLKPPLKSVPRGDWYCKDCKPKQLPRTPRKARRSTFDSTEEEKDEAEDSDSSEEEEEEDEQASSEEEVVEIEEDESEEEESEEEDQEEEEEEEEVESDAEEDDNDGEFVSSFDGEHDDVCGECRHGGQLLLCNHCPTAFHKECLDPPLGKIPAGPWICPLCVEGTANGDYDNDDHEDLCAKCNHGGELICCDKCPLAYHLECCEPPLSRVPKGDWKCEECAPKPKKKSQGGKGNAKESPTVSSKPAKGQAKKSQGSSSKVTSNRSTKGSTKQTNTPTDTTSRGKSRSRHRSPETDEEPQAAKRRATRRPGSAPATSEDDSATETPVVSRPRKRSLSRRSSTKSSRSASPEESERAKKPVRGGIKVVLGGGRRSRDSRNQSTDESEVEGSGPAPLPGRRRLSGGGRGSVEGQQVKLCEELLKELVKHPDSGPFRLPVSRKAVPDYHILIKRPMDFATMQTKFQTVEYQTPMEFIADCRLIFTNCQQYNVSSSYEAKCGRRLASFFEKRLRAMNIQEVSQTKAEDKDGEQPKKRPRRL